MLSWLNGKICFMKVIPPPRKIEIHVYKLHVEEIKIIISNFPCTSFDMYDVPQINSQI